MKILLIGGTWDNDNGCQSGYIRKLYDALQHHAHVTLQNGGTLSLLKESAPTIVLDYDCVLWFVNIDNSEDKILPLVAKICVDNGIHFIQSKNNRNGVYTDDQLFERINRHGLIYLVEFLGTDTIGARIHCIYGEASGTIYDINDLAESIMAHVDVRYVAPVKGKISDDRGTFGYVRKYHIHEGVDVYCQDGDPVVSIVDGTVIDMGPFTGKLAGSDWWNDTSFIAISTKVGVLLYGEIDVNDFKIGDSISAGTHLGKIVPVLRTDKGNGTTMLHLEYYRTKEYIECGRVHSWNLEMERPHHLLDGKYILTLAGVK